jgi:hypothetical protein
MITSELNSEVEKMFDYSSAFRTFLADYLQFEKYTTNTVAGSFKRGNKPSGSIKCWEFLDWLLASQEGLCGVKLVN